VLFNGLFAFALWFYSHKLKKKPLVGDITAAILTVAAFFAVCVYYGFVNRLILVYAVFIVLITLIRELVKNLETMKGDVVYNYQTYPVVHGIARTKRILYLLMTISVIPFGLLYASTPMPMLFWYFLFCMGMLSVAAWWISQGTEAWHFAKVNNLLKLLILSGVASIVFM
jgi:4-hydroxybenzoate polyprenyltransferase